MLSRFIQYCGSTSNAVPSAFAISGVIDALPLMTSLMWPGVTPRISARSSWVHPRASSSSRRNSPGGNASAGITLCILSPSLVVILNGDDDGNLIGSFSFQLQRQSHLVIEPPGALTCSVAFHLFE